jgi:uncharacterized protein (UPF0333 family)
MTPRKRRVLSLLLILLVIVVIGLGTYFIFFNKSDYQQLRVQRISVQEASAQKTSEYSKSSIRIYKYGAFEIQIIRTTSDNEDETLFVGNGTFTKTRSSYTFVYADSYIRVGEDLEQRKNFTMEHIIEKNGRIRIDTTWGVSYYFGK